jgi:hypothetical protein
MTAPDEQLSDSGGDYGYDLAHEASGPVGESREDGEPPDPVQVPTATEDAGGDYGYDLAHDVPRPAGSAPA